MKFRRHHNNKGLRHIKTGKTRKDVAIIAAKLAIPKPKRIDWKSEHWKIFSQWVRRDGICVFHAKLKEMGIPDPCRCAGYLQACHKVSRSKLAIKFDERNTFCGCAGSNAWSHFNEVEWSELWKRIWPEDVWYLESHKNDKAKFNSWYYKTEIDRLKKEIEKYQGGRL